MGRKREPIQETSDGRFRMTLYHLPAAKGKRPVIYLGRDKKQALFLEPLVRQAAMITENPDEAVELARQVVQADDPKAVCQRLIRIPVTTPSESDEEIRARLEKLGFPEGYLDEHPELVEQVNRKHAFNPKFLKQHGMAAAVRAMNERAKPLDKIKEEIAAQPRVPKYPADAGPRLSECFDVWKSFKADKSSKHHSKYRLAWDLFAEYLKDKPVSMLKKQDLADWQLHLKAIREKRGARWWNDNLQAVKAILDLCRRKTEFPLPEALPGWLDFEGDFEKYKPKPKNKQPLPRGVYDALIKVADDWARIDVEQYANALPIDETKDKRSIRMQKCNNAKQARRRKRDGMQFRAILRYAVQTSADNSDVCHLSWSHLHFDEPIPHMSLPRHKTGEPRSIPLLPSTIQALKDWRAYEPEHTPTVFRNDGKKKFVSEKVSEGFQRLRAAVKNGDGWDFKHIRNVAPNVGRDAGCSTEERDLILGHKPKTMTQQHYEDALRPEFLIRIVNAVGKELFNGEQVLEGTSPRGDATEQA